VNILIVNESITLVSIIIDEHGSLSIQSGEEGTALTKQVHDFIHRVAAVQGRRQHDDSVRNKTQNSLSSLAVFRLFSNAGAVV
jgi:hypothetical protein